MKYLRWAVAFYEMTFRTEVKESGASVCIRGPVQFTVLNYWNGQDLVGILRGIDTP